jgi:hypothetical protein
VSDEPVNDLPADWARPAFIKRMAAVGLAEPLITTFESPVFAAAASEGHDENLVRSASPPAIMAAVPIAEPAPEPVIGWQPRPTAKPGTRPKSRPGGKHASRRAAKPGTGLARQPEGRPRQLVAIRVAAVATAALVLFAVIAGTAEAALHGFRFFVFRSAGTGETPGSGLQEDQGPGQPDAPRPAPSHVTGQPRPHGTVTVPGGQ